MHRNLAETATLLGMGKLKLRTRLKQLGVLTEDGSIEPKYRERGLLFADQRAYFHHGIQDWRHYSVVMVTERGVDFLARTLGIEVRRMPPTSATA